MTWTDRDRSRLIDALVPSPELRDAYHNDPEFHALIQGLTRSLPAVIDWSLSQVPDRTARRAEATRLLNQGILPTAAAQQHARTGTPCTCGSDTPFSMGPNHTDDCPMLLRRRHPGEPT